MIIECPNCKSKYDVPDDKISGRKKLKCSTCDNIFAIQEDKGDSEESESKKDTAKITKQSIGESLWSDENLRLPDELKISIAVIKGARAGYIYHLEKPYVLIGRGKVELIIPDKEISRKHLAIEIRNDKVFLRDLGSTNGTFIDGDKVSILEIFDQTEFKVGQTTLMLITTPKNSYGK
ncbi:MAG: zinc-ribbon domain-containing protein [Candidatus Aminicenantes bacterium]|nr:zinc-ribbon domain-containing protein [Candidatus Aminicenantes bacterium]